MAGDNEDVWEEVEEVEEQDSYVVLDFPELEDLGLLQRYSTYKLKGLDGPRPTMDIGPYRFIGAHKEHLGTFLCFEEQNKAVTEGQADASTDPSEWGNENLGL
eukprot:GFYU01028360.1.p1 GENE.GFYU01028360.1~~GFYU01028360.1.p1  ORF type:complete len:103 (+),score=27.36 GFYU01028360.1:48-356(+)